MGRKAEEQLAKRGLCAGCGDELQWHGEDGCSVCARVGGPCKGARPREEEEEQA